jgi:hypothetical protein
MRPQRHRCRLRCRRRFICRTARQQANQAHHAPLRRRFSSVPPSPRLLRSRRLLLALLRPRSAARAAVLGILLTVASVRTAGRPCPATQHLPHRRRLRLLRRSCIARAVAARMPVTWRSANSAALVSERARRPPLPHRLRSPSLHQRPWGRLRGKARRHLRQPGKARAFNSEPETSSSSAPSSW